VSPVRSPPNVRDMMLITCRSSVAEHGDPQKMEQPGQAM
jgi:hypothetical protein